MKLWVQVKLAKEDATVENDDKSDESDEEKLSNADDDKSDKSDESDEEKLSCKGLLVFPNQIPHHHQSKLYIRQAYIDIYEMYIGKNDYILVSGTPGVGKSILSFCFTPSVEG